MRMKMRKQKNTRLRQTGNILLAFVLALGISAVPVQAAGLSAAVTAAEKKAVNLKQAKEITLKYTRGKNKADVKVIKKILEKNYSGDDISSYMDLDSSCYKWTKEGRLKELALDNDNLTGKLSLKGLAELSRLSVRNTNLTGLDVSKNPKLRYLDCEENKLASLDVSKNPKMENLDCCHNKLTSLDLSKSPKLKSVYCYGNKLKKFELK